MPKPKSIWVLGALLAAACSRGGESAVVIEPSLAVSENDGVPVEPFGAPSPAYAQLRDVTDAALGLPWDGELESFAPWLEEETASIERALALLKALRATAGDEYAVANARIALVYERIAQALTDASATADAVGYDADWKDQQGLIQEQANAFWARCVRLCGVAGPQLDAWDLRCQRGLSTGQKQSPRQPK
ncbi:MAG: hypothetical protein PVH21_17975 [Myxococcales bacterium]